MEDGIPYMSFQVDDLAAEFKRLKSLSVEFVQEPVEAGTVNLAVFNDTCGNLIQLMQVKDL